MSVDSHYLGNWANSSCAAPEQIQQWSCAMSPQQAPMSPEWPSPPSLQGYPTSYPTDHMRVPNYHPGLEQGYSMPNQDCSNMLWTKQALENQCQNYLRFSTQNLHATTVARRNERERNRVRHINGTFENLRQHLPCSSKKKKLSKVDTLRTAIRYIRHLKTILVDADSDSEDIKPVIKIEGAQEKSSCSKRQSLDSSVNSSSSAENCPKEQGLLEDCDEDEAVHSPEDFGASPCSTQQHTPVNFLGGEDFSWNSS